MPKAALLAILSFVLALPPPQAARADDAAASAQQDACVRRITDNHSMIARGSPQDRDLHYLCENNPSEAEMDCMTGYLRSDATLRARVEIPTQVCEPSGAGLRSCFDANRARPGLGAQASLEICAKYSDSWQRDCVGKYIIRGTFGGKSLDDQIFDAEIVCNVEKEQPELRDCMIRLRKGLPGTDGSSICFTETPKQRACYLKLTRGTGIQIDEQAGRQALAICQRPLSDGDIDCAARYVHKGGLFQQDPYTAAFYCSPEGADRKACFDDIESKHVIRNMADIDQACDKLKTAEQRACIVNNAGIRALAAFQDRMSFCSIPSQGGRDCVLGYLTSGRIARSSDALKICSYRASDTRECLVDFVNRGTPSAGASAALFAGNVVGGIDDAALVCEVSNRADRECVVRTMRDKRLTAKDAVPECMKKSDQRESCRLLISEYYNIGDWTGICDVANFEIRACLYDKYEAAMNAPRPFWESGPRVQPLMSEFMDQCLAEFVSNLTLPMNGIAHGVGCRFQQ